MSPLCGSNFTWPHVTIFVGDFLVKLECAQIHRERMLSGTRIKPQLSPT